MELLARINKVYPRLTDQDKQILSRVQQEKEGLASLTSQGLADACFVSRATIFRLLKKLELDSFAELKYLVAQEQALPAAAQTDFQRVVQTYHTYIDQIFEKQDLSEIVGMLLETDCLYLYGTGNEQKLEVEMMRQLLTSIGKRVIVFFDKGEYDYIKDNVQATDLLILVSYKGESEEGRAILQDSRLRGLRQLVVTRTSQNTMAQLSAYQLYVPSESIQTPTRLTYEISTTFYFIIDQLCYDYLKALEDHR